MRLISSRSLLSSAPLTLLTVHTLLNAAAPVSASISVAPFALAGAAFATSAYSMNSQPNLQKYVSKAALSKMSNGEGYVDEVSVRGSKLIQDSIEFFSARPTQEIYKRSFTPHTVFEDPLCYAKGERQVKAQFWGLAAAFSKCELLAWHVTKDEPKQVNYVQRQRYTFKGLGLSKEMVSTIAMTLDDDGKIVHYQDRWNHNDPPAGFIAWPLRRLNAVCLPYLISFPAPENSKPAHSDL